jgi:hypothetical protein
LTKVHTAHHTHTHTHTRDIKHEILNTLYRESLDIHKHNTPLREIDRGKRETHIPEREVVHTRTQTERLYTHTQTEKLYTHTHTENMR